LELTAPYGKHDFVAAVERLVALGGEPTAVDLGPFRRIAELLYGGAFVAERLEAAGDLLRRDPDAIEPTVRAILRGALDQQALDLFRSQHAAQQLRTQTEALWDDVDFLLVPTAPTLPLVTDVQREPIKLNAFLGRYTNFVNLLDLCALAVPAGYTAQGLPFGVTLIAPRSRDGQLASVGRLFHRAQQSTSTAPSPRAAPAPGLAQLAVVGAHLAGEPLNHQLTERRAKLVRSARTAPRYKLFALPTTPPKPGLVRVPDAQAGHAIEVEVWQLTNEALGSFLHEVGSPLCIGRLELEDGTRVLGFLCEGAAVQGQRDISSFGGWRSFRRSLA
jgi:allophanate hydrolase